MSTKPSSLHTDADPLDVLVIGAGQAGLAIARHLKEAQARLLVLEAAAELGHTWRSRWDSPTLFSPSQYDSLPGMAFPAAPDPCPAEDRGADHLTDYAAFDLPIQLDGSRWFRRCEPPARSGAWMYTPDPGALPLHRRTGPSPQHPQGSGGPDDAHLTR